MLHKLLWLPMEIFTAALHLGNFQQLMFQATCSNVGKLKMCQPVQNIKF